MPSPGKLNLGCPDCGRPVQDEGIQGGVCPGTGEAASYAMYYCPNSADVTVPDADTNVDDLCYGGIKVYETGFVSISHPDEEKSEVLDFSDRV